MKKFKTIVGKYYWILIVFIFGIGSYYILLSMSESNFYNIPVITKYLKIELCKKKVLSQIKSPTTAIFSNMEYKFNSKQIATGEYLIEEGSGVKIQTKLNSGNIVRLYTDTDGVTSGYINILSGGYIETYKNNYQSILDDQKEMDEISTNIKYSYSISELNNYKEKYNKTSNDYIYRLQSNNAILLFIRHINNIVITGNIDSQNGYGAMIRSSFECDQVEGEDMYPFLNE